MCSSSPACQISDQMSILPTSFSHRKLWKGEWEGGAEKAAGPARSLFSCSLHSSSRGLPTPLFWDSFPEQPQHSEPCQPGLPTCAVSAEATRTVTVTHFLSTGLGKAQEHSSDQAEVSLSQVLNQPWLYGRHFICHLPGQK